MEKTLKVALVGCGKIAQLKYLPALRRRKDVVVSHLIDTSNELTRYLLATFNFTKPPHVGDDLGELLAAPPDAALVLNHDHFEPAARLAEAGVDLLIEKPVCWTEAQASTLERIAGGSGARLFCAYIRRHDPAAQVIRNTLVERGPPSLVRILQCAGHSPRDHNRDFKPLGNERDRIKASLLQGWADRFGGDARSPGAQATKLLLDLLIHDLDILLWLFEDVQLTHAEFAFDATNQQVTSVMLALRTPLGTPCLVTCVPAFAAPWPWRHSFEAIWRDHSIEASFASPFASDQTACLRTWSTGAPAPLNDWTKPVSVFDLVVEEFVANIRTPGWRGTNMATACRALELIEDAERRFGAQESVERRMTAA